MNTFFEWSGKVVSAIILVGGTLLVVQMIWTQLTVAFPHLWFRVVDFFGLLVVTSTVVAAAFNLVRKRKASLLVEAVGFTLYVALTVYISYVISWLIEEPNWLAMSARENGEGGQQLMESIVDPPAAIFPEVLVSIVVSAVLLGLFYFGRLRAHEIRLKKD